MSGQISGQVTVDAPSSRCADVEVREGGNGVIDEALTSRSASDRTTWLSAGFFATVIAAHAVGVLGVVTYPLVIVGGIVCAFVGVRRHRPSVRWPWWAMVMSGLLWAVAGVVREGHPSDP